MGRFILATNELEQDILPSNTILKEYKELNKVEKGFRFIKSTEFSLFSISNKKIRLREKISQPIFASFLNVSPSTVKKWESGEKVPSGIALRLLNVVDHKGLNVIRG